MGENRRFRNHISIVAEQIGGGIAALVVVIVTLGIQNIEELSRADMSFLESGAFLVIPVLFLLLLFTLGNRLLVWAKTYICIEENAVVIERNTVNKKKNTIGIQNISNINLEQNLFEMLLGTCKVKLDTNSRSTADKTDVQIVLKKADAERFKSEIARRMKQAQGDSFAETAPAIDLETGAGAEEEFDIRSDFGDILQHGLFSINIFSLLILIGGIVSAVTALIRVTEQPALMRSALSAAAAIVVAASVVISALWDTLKDFIRYYNFRAKRTGNKINIRYGLLKKMEYTIPVDKIQALKIRQSFVARIFRRYMAEIVNVGMGDEKEEQNSFLVLYATEDKMAEQLELLLPEYADSAKQKVEPVPAGAWAVWSVPGILFAVCVFACAFLLSVVADEYRMAIWLCAASVLGLTLLGMILWYASSGMGAGRDFLKLSCGYFGRRYISVRYENIQYAQVRQGIIARRLNISRGSIHLLASSANAKHIIPYFRAELAEQIRQRMISCR